MEDWLEMFAALMMLAAIDGTRADDEWHTSTKIDPIDDTWSASALRAESFGPWQEAGRYRLLNLRCEETESGQAPDVYALILWNMTAEDVSNPRSSDEPWRSVEILTRFGDEAPRKWTYRYAGLTDEMFATVPEDMESFLREAARAPKMALRFEGEERTGMQTTVFDLTGSARIIRRMAGGCAIDSEGRDREEDRRETVHMTEELFGNETEGGLFEEQSFPEAVRSESGLPPHAHPNVLNTDWECDRGYLRSGDRCVRMNMPPHAHPDVFNTGWECDRGYLRSGDRCVRMNMPPHAHPDVFNTGWECDRGYLRSGDRCVRMNMPPHAHPNVFNTGWECERGYLRSSDRCVRMNMPPHAHPNVFNTGWECERGYLRSSDRCVRM